MLTDDRLILLTGASGYVGGRLLTRLEGQRRRVRCLVRRPETLEADRPETTEVVRGDLLDPPSLTAAMEGVDTAYYLVHSMGRHEGFERYDRMAAINFAILARRAGVRRIIYLGGLGEPEGELSAHLRSRHEVGKILRTSQVPVIELRASIIIGAGGLSFELIRALVDRLPVMVCPRWVNTLTQPIAVDDVLDYLIAAADLPDAESRVFEIGGPDVVAYGEIMREYARQRGGVRRLMIPVPVLTPWLSSLWLALVTPVQARVGRKLIDGLRNPTVVRDDSARRVFDVRPRSLREAIARAIAEEAECRSPVTGEAGAKLQPTEPAIEVSESERSLEIRLNTPGIRPEEVVVDVTDVAVEIRGRNPTGESGSAGDSIEGTEPASDGFSTSVPLPCPVCRDGVETHHDHGRLTITLPKSPAAASQMPESNAIGSRPES